MKIMKIKFGLLSLLAVLAVSVFLTSCEQEVPITPELDQISESEIDSEMSLDIYLPEHITSLNEEDIQTYISKMSNDELSNAAKDLIIIEYLRKLDKLNDFKIQMQEGTLQGVDLSETLGEDNLSELNSKLNMVSNNEISNRCTVVCEWRYHCNRWACFPYRYCYSY